MHGKAKASDYEGNFEAIIQELEDEQLIDILRKRKLYQDEAASAAIREAIKRDIISSEEDLFAPEFRHESLMPRLFPLIESPKNRNRIRRSISRGLLLTGLLPTIWGMVRLNAGFRAEGLLLISYGVVWMSISAFLIRKYSVNAVWFLFAFLALSVIYVVHRLIQIPQLVIMDVFVIVVLYSLAVYGLLFLLRLRE